MTRLRPGAASAGSCRLDQEASRSLAGNLFGISLVMETPSLRFGRGMILHTKRRAGNGREEYPEPRKRYGNALAEMVALRGAVWQADAPAPQAVVPSHTNVHKNLRSKSISVSLKHPWRPERGRVPYPRVGVQGESQNQGCQESGKPCTATSSGSAESYLTGNLMGTRTYHGDYEETDYGKGQRREEHGGWTSAKTSNRTHGGDRPLYILGEAAPDRVFKARRGVSCTRVCRSYGGDLCICRIPLTHTGYYS